MSTVKLVALELSMKEKQTVNVPVWAGVGTIMVGRRTSAFCRQEELTPATRTMLTTPHIERHFTATATVRDIGIGMADGLTVPFALAAGLSGVVDSTALIITTTVQYGCTVLSSYH